MSEYYTPLRKSGLYTPGASAPFKISRSKIELFMECPRCFYLDRKIGVSRPPGFPFALNSAVDRLLKEEFDIHRAQGSQHPLIKEYGIDALPISHEQLDDWRNNFRGVRHLHQQTNFLVYGAIDDLWQNSQGEYIVVDYKSTSKTEKITELNQPWQLSYKRQMEIYQWLLARNGLKVFKTGYFVYCNGISDKKAFDKKLEFEITLIPYKGNSSWVENTLCKMKQCLESNTLPPPGSECDYCLYYKTRQKINKQENND